MDIFKIKKINNKYKIVFNTCELITYENVLIKYNLLYKKSIDEELYNKIVKDNEYYFLYNKVLDLLNKKIKCTFEIESYLKKYTDNSDYINRIVADLKEKRLLNDEIYTKSFIQDKLYLSNYGPNKIKKELINYKINENIIDESLKIIDTNFIYNKLNKLVDKKIKNNKYSINYLKQKLVIELYNLGYEKSMILDILSNKIISSNIENDYNKIYNKLSKKYSGYELTNIIKSKLYSKGYTLDEINKKTN